MTTVRGTALFLATAALSKLYNDRPYDAERQLDSMTPSELRQLRMNLRAMLDLATRVEDRKPTRHSVYPEPANLHGGMDEAAYRGGEFGGKAERDKLERHFDDDPEDAG